MSRWMIVSAVSLAGLVVAGVAEPSAASRKLSSSRMVVEYRARTDRASIACEAESEDGLDGVVISNPLGVRVAEFHGGFRRSMPLSTLNFETQDMPLSDFEHTFAPGRYQLRGRSAAGELVLGFATLSFDLRPAPQITYPSDGATGIATRDLVLRWNPDPAAIGYHVVLEQDENDGLTVELPAGTDSFDVPSQLLARNSRTHFEVAAIASNGNRTVSESTFTTAP